MKKKSNYLLTKFNIMKKNVLLTIAIMLFSSILIAQTNVSVATATLVNSFPYTEYNVNSSNGGTAIGMNGACWNIACCSTLVYRIETPVYGSLRVECSNFVPLTGSVIAYSPDIPEPLDYSDLTYWHQPGNFCGFRDTLEMGMAYNWGSHFWVGTPDINDPAQVLPPGAYYVLLFNHNNQNGQGTISDFTFEFAVFCPDGYSCSATSVTMCDGGGYLSPSGNLYTTSGNYQDTLFGAAQGGLDSLIFTNLTVNLTDFTQDLIADEMLCPGEDTLEHASYTDYVSYSDFVKADENWIECNAVVPSLDNTNRSVFGWMKHPNQVSSNGQVLVAINTSTGGNICNLQIGTNEQLGVYDGSNSHYTGVVVTDGLWHYVGYTYDEATNETKMYVDGIMEGSYSNGQSVTSSSQVSLGQEFDSGNSTGNFLDGLFTEVSIWNEVLDSAEIAFAMTRVIYILHPKYANLQAHYPMITTCNSDNLIIDDYSPNDNDANASANDIQILDNLEQITGFNSTPYYDKNWIVDGSSVSTADTLELLTYDAGNYKLELNRDFFTISDDWVVTFDPDCDCVPTVSTIDPTACDSYTSPSGNYTWTITNSYQDTVLNVAGCDSIITINLTINNSVINNATAVVECDSAQINGNWYYTTQTVTDFFAAGAANGCDSTVITPLTINNSIINNAPAVVECDSSLINDNWYYTSQTVTDLFAGGAANGCDSTVITPLTINNSVINNAPAVVECDSALINGNWYYISQTVTDFFAGGAANGCDSTVITPLTINNSVINNAAPVVECDSAQINGNWYYTSQTITDLFAGGAANGCDSTVITPLTIQSSSTAYAGEDATIMEGESYYIFDATATNYETLEWSTDGTGYFDDPNILNPTYFSGTGETGIVILSLSVDGFAPCGTVFSSMNLEILEGYPLNFGYQFVSTRIIPYSPDILDVLSNNLENIDFVRNSAGQMLSKIGPNWVNSIGDWICTEGYLFRMLNPDILTISGSVIDPQTPISLALGYQLISFLPESPVNTADAFANVLNNLDFVRNTAGQMFRKIGPNWINTIGDMQPWEGYLVKMIAEDVLIYPETTDNLVSIKTPMPEHFKLIDANPLDPVWTIYFEQGSLSKSDEIGIYDGEILAGAGVVVSDNIFENAIPVFSNLYEVGNSPIIKVWDKSENEEYILSNYTFSNPYQDAWTENVFPAEDAEYSLLHFSTTGVLDENPINLSFTIYPNPSEGIFNILIDGISEKIQVKVFDIHGNNYRFFGIEGTRSMKTEKLDLNELPAGVYFINFSGKDFNQVKKIVIQ
jgi:hypothetical protein